MSFFQSVAHLWHRLREAEEKKRIDGQKIIVLAYKNTHAAVSFHQVVFFCFSFPFDRLMTVAVITRVNYLEQRAGGNYTGEELDLRPAWRTSCGVLLRHRPRSYRTFHPRN